MNTSLMQLGQNFGLFAPIQQDPQDQDKDGCSGDAIGGENETGVISKHAVLLALLLPREFQGFGASV